MSAIARAIQALTIAIPHVFRMVRIGNWKLAGTIITCALRVAWLEVFTVCLSAWFRACSVVIHLRWRTALQINQAKFGLFKLTLLIARWFTR